MSTALANCSLPQTSIIPVEPATYTRPISGDEVIIDATDGSVAIYGSIELFKGGIYNYSSVTLGVQGQARGLVKVAVHEQVKNANFAQIFGNLDQSFFTEHQVVKFVQTYRNWPRTGGHAKFIPFMVGDEKLVAVVHFDVCGELTMDVRCFSSASVWDVDARRCFVVLEMEPSVPCVP